MSTLEEVRIQSTLSAEMRRKYEQDGFLVIRGVFKAEEIVHLSSEAERLLDRTDLIDKQNLRCRFQGNCTGGECLFETFDPVIDLAPAFRDVAFDSRILELLGQLYEQEACLLKDKLIFKPPGAMGYALHQDYIAWPGFPRSFLTVLVPIDATNEQNGCTEVIAGPASSGSALAGRRRLSRSARRMRPRFARRDAGAPAGRSGRLRRVHTAPFGPEPVRPLAAATLSELQRRIRRRRSATRALSRLSAISPPEVCGIRIDGHLFPLSRFRVRTRQRGRKIPSHGYGHRQEAQGLPPLA